MSKIRSITHYPADHAGCAYLVRVKRRPGQSFVTRDPELLEEELALFRQLGWKYEVEQISFREYTDTQEAEGLALLRRLQEWADYMGGWEADVWKDLLAYLRALDALPETTPDTGE